MASRPNGKMVIRPTGKYTKLTKWQLDEMAKRQMASRQIASRQMASRKMASRQMGSRQNGNLTE
jgi:hypothetical protein